MESEMVLTSPTGLARVHINEDDEMYWVVYDSKATRADYSFVDEQLRAHDLEWMDEDECPSVLLAHGVLIWCAKLEAAWV